MERMEMEMEDGTTTDPSMGTGLEKRKATPMAPHAHAPHAPVPVPVPVHSFGFVADLKTTVGMVRRNRNYRLFLCSHLCQNAGNWFVRVAGLLVVDRFGGGSGGGGGGGGGDSFRATSVSYLVLTRTLPPVIMAPWGGVLADRYDRRRTLVTLDLISTAILVATVVAVSSPPFTTTTTTTTTFGVGWFYAAMAARSCVGSLYVPSAQALLPMLVDGRPDDLVRATTLNSTAWSGMMVIGGVLAGALTATLGVEACYAIDAATYLGSAGVISLIGGNFRVSAASSSSSPPQPPPPLTGFQGAVRMGFVDLVTYLRQCGFGALVFLKASACLTWGPGDVLGVSFARVDGDEEETSRRIGLMYSCIGIGCLLGPTVINLTYLKGRHGHGPNDSALLPVRLQLSCIVALLIMSLGWLGIAVVAQPLDLGGAAPVPSSPTNLHTDGYGYGYSHGYSYDLLVFRIVCVLTVFRTFGSAILYVNSTLLLTTLTDPPMLGRVLALEFGVSQLVEAAIAYATGRFEDRGYEAHQLSGVAALIGVSMATLWSVYHVNGGGAVGRTGAVSLRVSSTPPSPTLPALT